MNKVKLNWIENKYQYRKVLDMESMEKIKKLLINKLWDFWNLFRVYERGIETRDWRSMWRRNDWMVTKIKYLQEEFNFSLVEKKYLEYKRIYDEENLEYERMKKFNKVKSDFLFWVKTPWVEVYKSSWSDECTLSIEGCNVDIYVDNDGVITKVTTKYEVFQYDWILRSIDKLITIRDVENKLWEEIGKKNIYTSIY